jgi:acetyl/propionyl-CoA carboxylase alpha subunit
MSYRDNPLVHSDRRLAPHDSAWVRSFSVEDVRPLIVCRGPIRKEAIDVFREMGMTQIGILLSDKDSIIYPGALAPELRDIAPERVHRVEDYSGATKEARQARMAEIVGLCRKHGYDTVFAGYGFMAEDVAFVRYLEKAGLRFMGPCSKTQQAAGKKDEAKRTALANDVSVTPGVDDLTTRTLLGLHPSIDDLKAVARKHGLPLATDAFGSGLERAASAVLAASYEASIDLFDIDTLCAQVEKEAYALFVAHPDKRVRLKAIGGGGGKGQRLLAAPGVGDEAARAAAALAPDKAREVLAEVKATGVGDDKNMLLELNIEQTRHNEIQLLGNGSWCVSLGGRDCSLQMHEQKLLEVSVTREELTRAIAAAEEAGRSGEAAALRQDHTTLVRMEEEGARFGRAVGLDSASTFECIVDGDRHYFMEVNTRIQVEHRVSELCYALRFDNPDDPEDGFTVTSLVEAMALCGRHKERLPKPRLVERQGAAVEARLNATNDALQPHAGGRILSWSEPLPFEVRDDQGICLHNPDTGAFVDYVLAGAYDSNIALLVTAADQRQQSYARLQEILRSTKIRGDDLATNLNFHYGLVSWFAGWNVWAKPTTRFVVPYLTQVGLLGECAQHVDATRAFDRLAHAASASAKTDAGKQATTSVLSDKRTLLSRPLQALLSGPHVLSGWLAMFRERFAHADGRFRWLVNPLVLLKDSYHFLNMERWQGAPPAYVIWRHDEELLDRGLAFYEALEERLPGLSWTELDARLKDSGAPDGFDDALWRRVCAAHQGHQLGLEMLGLAAMVGIDAGFYELRVDDELGCVIPERLHDAALQTRMARVLAPPPATLADEIVAVTGGMFYAQESPSEPPFITKGEHFDKGQPLYIIEVMKMFNRVAAPFAGTVDEVLIPDGEGVIVKKGQALFKVTPDEPHVEEDPRVIAERRNALTDRLMAAIDGGTSTAG